MEPKRVVILGSTGSIGCSTLDVIAALPGRFTVAGLAAGRNHIRLIEQARKHEPKAVSILDPDAAEHFGQALPGLRGIGRSNRDHRSSSRHWRPILSSTPSSASPA